MLVVKTTISFALAMWAMVKSTILTKSITFPTIGHLEP